MRALSSLSRTPVRPSPPHRTGPVRVLVGGLKPRTVYWYRFIDSDGNGSRAGRTITAPEVEDVRTVRFAFVSCQSVNEGTQNAYRRMIWEDQRAAPENRLAFVLHLGISFTKSWNTPMKCRIATIARCSTSAAYPMLARSTTSMYRRPSMAIAWAHCSTLRDPDAARRARPLSLRLYRRESTVSACGKAGKAPSSTTASRNLHRRCASLPIKRGGNIFHHGYANRPEPGWISSMAHN